MVRSVRGSGVRGTCEGTDRAVVIVLEDAAVAYATMVCPLRDASEADRGSITAEGRVGRARKGVHTSGFFWPHLRQVVTAAGVTTRAALADHLTPRSACWWGAPSASGRRAQRRPRGCGGGGASTKPGGTVQT